MKIAHPTNAGHEVRMIKFIVGVMVGMYLYAQHTEYIMAGMKRIVGE